MKTSKPLQRQPPKIVPGHELRPSQPLKMAEGFVAECRCSWTSPLGSKAKDVQRSFRQHKAEHGDITCAADLERTEAQRWADALVRMAEMAASADLDAQGPRSEHIILWRADTYLSHGAPGDLHQPEL